MFDADTDRIPNRTAALTKWLLRLAVSVAFIGFGVEKFREPFWVHFFARLGFGQWFRYVTGVIEIVGAVLVVVPGLTLADNKRPIHWVALTAEMDEKGAARGTLVLDATPPEFDEYGDLITGNEIEPVERKHAALPPLEFKCLVETAKSGVVLRVNEPAVERQVYRLKSPKLKSTLLFATLGPGLTTGRLMVMGADNRVELVIELRDMRPLDPVLHIFHPLQMAVLIQPDQADGQNAEDQAAHHQQGEEERVGENGVLPRARRHASVPISRFTSSAPTARSTTGWPTTSTRSTFTAKKASSPRRCRSTAI